MKRLSVLSVFCFMSFVDLMFSTSTEPGYFGPCRDDHHCYLENTECIQEHCQCLQTHYKEGDKICIPKKENGAECMESFQCTDNQAECVDHLCTCKDGLFVDTNNANMCKEKYDLGSICSREILDQCADANAECRVDTSDTYHCLCKTTHYMKGFTCVPRIVENGECQHGGKEKQCLDKMVCKNVDGIYKCQYENEDVLGSSCTASPTNDGINDQCTVPDAECREDIDDTMKCLCKTTHYQSSNDDCIPRKGLNEICIKNGNVLQCLEDTYCKMVDNVYKCQGEMETGNGFTSTTQFRDPNTNCIENICQCKPGFFKDTDTGMCHPKIGLEIGCPPKTSDQCADDNAECNKDESGVFKCVCKTTHYNNNNQCLPRKTENEECDKGGHELQCFENASCKLNTNVYKCMCDDGVDFNGECNGVNELLPRLLCIIVTILTLLHCIVMT